MNGGIILAPALGQGIVHCCRSARWTRVAFSPVPRECLFSFLKPQNLSTWALPFPLRHSSEWPISSTYRTRQLLQPTAPNPSISVPQTSCKDLQNEVLRFLPAPVPSSVLTLGISSSPGCNNQTARQRQLEEIGFVLAHHLGEEIVRHDENAWGPECDATICTRCARRESVVLGSLSLLFFSLGLHLRRWCCPHLGGAPHHFNSSSDLPNSMSLRWSQIHSNGQQRLTVTELPGLWFWKWAGERRGSGVLRVGFLTWDVSVAVHGKWGQEPCMCLRGEGFGNKDQ